MVLVELFNALRVVFTILSILFFFAFFVYILMIILYNHKRNQSLETDMQKIIREGRGIVRKNKIGSLYLSSNYKKPIHVGKIISTLLIKEVNEKISRVFVLKTGTFKPFIFMKCSTFDMKGDLTGDITLKRWNFTNDEEGKFYIENTISYDINVKKINDELVDVLSNIAPMVHKSILANPIHRIRLREKKLIKLPDEEKRDLFVRRI